MCDSVRMCVCDTGQHTRHGYEALSVLRSSSAKRERNVSRPALVCSRQKKYVLVLSWRGHVCTAAACVSHLVLHVSCHANNSI